MQQRAYRVRQEADDFASGGVHLDCAPLGLGGGELVAEGRGGGLCAQNEGLAQHPARTRRRSWLQGGGEGTGWERHEQSVSTLARDTVTARGVHE